MEAATIYRRIIKMDPTHALAHRSLGNVLLAQGKNDEALSHYWLALERAPKDPLTHAALGVVLLKKNRVAEATTQFLETTRLQPTNAVANSQLAQIYQTKMISRRQPAFIGSSLIPIPAHSPP